MDVTFYTLSSSAYPNDMQEKLDRQQKEDYRDIFVLLKKLPKKDIVLIITIIGLTNNQIGVIV